jgi:hypothetical protein
MEPEYQDKLDPGAAASKRYKVKVLKKQVNFSLRQAVIFIIVFGLIGGAVIWKSFAASPNGGGRHGGSVKTYTPMAVVSDNHQTTTDPARTCESEDDFLDWEVKGSLNPGESYTFQSKTPMCESGNVAYGVSSTWDQSTIKLSTKNLTSDSYEGDISSANIQVGKDIAATNVGPNEANACLFENNSFPDNNPPGSFDSPYKANDNSSINPSFTVTNVGTTTAYTIDMVGIARNGWIQNMLIPCHKADADHDGWNDLFEWGTLMTNAQSSTGGLEQNRLGLNGMNYLSYSSTSAPDNETDSYAPDFNDDGLVDQADVDRLQTQLGQGNGIGLTEIRWDCTYTAPICWAQNRALWRRFDLNADGKVDSHDMAIEQSFAGKAIPMATDTTHPTVEFRLPLASAPLPNGTGTNIQVLATDNEYLTKVAIAVNGTIKCTKEQPDSRGAATGDYTCGWTVPKGAGKTYTITATGYDQAGNTTSASVVVTSS